MITPYLTRMHPYTYSTVTSNFIATRWRYLALATVFGRYGHAAARALISSRVMGWILLPGMLPSERGGPRLENFKIRREIGVFRAHRVRHEHGDHVPGV